MTKAYLIIILILFFGLSLSAQELHVNANHKTLNEVLIELRDNYNLNLSFDDKELSKYKISLNKDFETPQKAFQFLLKDIPITYEMSGNVYIFYSKIASQKETKSYFISGKIIDDENLESLPYTHTIINGFGGVTDEYGNFHFESKSDSVFQIRISYLGYQILDTILNQGIHHQIKMLSASVNLDEIVIYGDPVISIEETGSKAGLIRMNHKVALFVPGNGDNSVFNLMRLQPGILAAGEQSSEMIIWGSYAGQTQVNFDGMTLFGLKNYNDNISSVNPYMAKDIRIHKGGFDATLGERVGGIIDITGIEGNKKKPELNLNINNMTMNALAEIPLGNKMSVVGAYRQTYYELYAPIDINSTNTSHGHFTDNSIIVKPKYKFRDGNIKFSGQTNQGDSYHLSTFWGQDQFSYSLDQDHVNTAISQELKEDNRQYGLRANYNKPWSKKGSSEISIAYSSLQHKVKDVQNSSEIMMHHNIHSQYKQTQNNISELKTKLTGNLKLNARHKLNFGGGLLSNTTLLKETSSNLLTKNELDKGSQMMVYFQDKILLGKKIYFTVGMRTDFSMNIQKLFFQPRLNLVYKPVPKLQFNASWGLYNQFIVLSSNVDQFNNYTYLWMVSDGDQVPVLKSQHFVIGGIFKQKGFSGSIEGFYKETKGITRLIQMESQSTLYSGINKAKGIDFFVKQEYKGHSVGISYSISQSLEWFPFFQSSDYKSSLHDQRHEIKFSGIINLSPFFISANYIYGSGFLKNTNLAINSTKNYPYKRLDIAGLYRFSLKKMKLDVGFSILNLLNYENIKITDITQIPSTEASTISIYSEAVPFTPTLFLNISL